MIKLFLDDIRTPSEEGWTIVRNIEDAKCILKTNKVTEISLDHDLGEDQSSGYDLAKWMTTNKLWPEKVKVHSMNPTGSQNIIKEYKFYLKYKEHF